MDINYNHYKILKILYEKNKISPLNSMSINEIIILNKINLSRITIYKQLLSLVKNGYINIGLKLGKENTYYITQLGINIKEQMEGVVICG